MKTGILTTKTIASDDIKDTKSIMGMSMKGMEIAQYFLRDKIYTDKILAVIREYVCNALDEHVKHNIDVPVDVSIKRVNAQWVWAVRDYALGLNEHDIRNVFGMYFESTKNNDNDCIGGFGIGGKAGFSYTDTFYVVSHHNGIKTNYVCTLGAGTKGVPVGEIYKISEEPTGESGIEISLEIKSYDEADFSGKTKMLVGFLHHDSNITFDDKYNNKVVVPIRPFRTETMGNYEIHSYDENTPNYSGTRTFNVRMGGIIYPHSTSTKVNRAFANSVVIDVPIGKLSIPISREAIENTPLNDKVFSEIEKHLDELFKKDSSNLTVPKFGSLVTGNIPFGGTFEGKWFNFNFKELFPKTVAHYYAISRRFDSHERATSEKVSKGNVNHVIYIYPDIKNLNNWHKRMIKTLSDIKGDKYDGFVYMPQKYYDALMVDLDSTIDISDCKFMNIKTMKLPKLEKVVSTDETSYVVYEGYGYQKSFTANRLNSQVIKAHFNDTEPDDDWYDQCKSMEEVNQRTIGDSKVYGTRSVFRTANSKKMIENLVELGWLTPEMDEYKEVKKKFDEIYRHERFVAGIDNTLHSLFYGSKHNAKTKAIIAKTPTKLDRLTKVKQLLHSEESVRGRILRSLNTYDRKLTRQDLRKLLSLKD